MGGRFLFALVRSPPEWAPGITNTYGFWRVPAEEAGNGGKTYTSSPIQGPPLQKACKNAGNRDMGAENPWGKHNLHQAGRAHSDTALKMAVIYLAGEEHARHEKSIPVRLETCEKRVARFLQLHAAWRFGRNVCQAQ